MKHQGFVGNDIVDLQAPGNPGKSNDQRFLARVFTEKERAFISGAWEPDRALWSLWAAKEAVYKVAVKIYTPCIFSPVKFEVFPHEPSLTAGAVLYEKAFFSVTWVQSPEFVHAWSGESSENRKIWSRVERREGQESLSVRKTAQRLIAALGYPSPEIVGRPPRVVFPPGKVSLPEIEISLSHDGAWGAVVLSAPGPLTQEG